MKALQYPFAEADVRRLRVGDAVAVTGRVFTGRDRFHKFLAEGGAPPVPLRDACMYHCGPVVIQERGAWVVKAAGPTTSSRQEPYTDCVVRRHGVRVLIGKGGMGEATRQVCRAAGAVYVHTIGGAAALLAGHVVRVHGVYLLKEFGSAEAVWDLEVADLPGLVTIDAAGRSLHRRVAAASRRRLQALL